MNSPDLVQQAQLQRDRITPIPPGMKNSVALLIAARAELAVHEEEHLIVANLCRTFGVGTGDALAAVVAAQLLADQPGSDERRHCARSTPPLGSTDSSQEWLDSEVAVSDAQR